MKFKFNLFYNTALLIAVENENVEIINLLLENDNINPNIYRISKYIIAYKSEYILTDIFK